MSSTTLMTFLLQTSPTTSSVSLLGSWDNFSKPYPMQKDLRTGRGHWRGCHTFENIICDGELDSIHQKRNGGLKMGGKYWYYYQLDGDTEYHNPAEPATTSCPLLPGQPLNVLDVPTQIGEGDVRARSGSTSSAVGCTMNPEDKYLNPRAAPVPMLPRLTTSQTSLHGATDHSSSPRSGRSPWSAKSGRSSPCSGSPASFGRLLSYARKASVGRVSRSLSPPTSPSRHAIFVHSPAPKSADAELESDRGRRGFNRIDRELHIGDPILISRTDESRHCVPLRVAQSAPPSRISSLRASPIEERLLVSFSAAEKPASCVQDVYPSRPQVHSRSRSQEPSPLRNAVCPKDLPIRLDITASRKGITNLDAENNKVQTPSEALSEEEPHVASLTYPVIIPEIVTGAESSPAQLVEASSKKSLPDSDIN
ncbi:MAG: hypothetical protein M1830_005721, partial [Pleopsidium flavum]